VPQDEVVEQTLQDAGMSPGPVREPDEYADRFAKRQVEPAVFVRTMREAIDAIAGKGIDYALIGGIASAVHGRPRRSDDVDIFVRRRDADPALDALAEAGFATQKTIPEWLYKGIRDGVLVDVIFRAQETMYLDDAMLERVREAEFDGERVRVVSAEDLLLMKAASADESTPHYWYDALALISYGDLDWDYLLERAHLAPRRLISLLVYAESNDMLVPSEAVRGLFARVYGSE
jgi:predicted nucleotidyltransferase